MKVTLLRYTENADELCGMAAATCYNSKDYLKALRHSAGNGHESVIEHAYYTFKIEDVSRTLLAQLTRHRLCAFSVQSQRYTKLLNREDETAYVLPGSLSPEQKGRTMELFEEAQDLYTDLVESGVPAEDARFVIPQAVCTTIIMSCNARELKHIFAMRCCNRAQWEIRQLADEMYRLVYPKAKQIFATAGPGCVNGLGCHEGRPCGHPRNLGEWHNEC